MKKPTGKLKDRLEVGAELICFDGKTLVEKVKVIEVDKKAKTAKLSNLVVIHRHPDNEGNFLYYGDNKKAKRYQIRQADEEMELLLKANTARNQLYHMIPELKKFLDSHKNTSLFSKDGKEKLIKIHQKLSKTLKDA